MQIVSCILSYALQNFILHRDYFLACFVECFHSESLFLG
uniref:Uncharacterized protein n=1 Tax=Arundo donax TaxID=35708 RepID=A0A0A9BJ91_ARUDO